jgi:hypothetical protein
VAETEPIDAVPLPGEPVWTGGHRKRLTLEMENSNLVEAVDLGVADRPSEVARLLRQAASDIELAFHQANDRPAGGA